MKKAIETLKNWFQQEKRNFPWRNSPSPYAVWISEVMLQQTRAAVVIPYFERWMKRFPSIQSLADATVDEVIKMWEGLGYYSRARALHEGARYVVAHYHGKLPSLPHHLQKVKGLGSYTIGAIRSFAFHQKAPAVDGNVMRVISRLYCYEEEIDQQLAKKQIQKKVKELLPDTEPWVIMEALIELGATICVKNPQCEKCPMQEICEADRRGKAEQLPRKKRKEQTILLQRSVFVIYHQREFLIQRQEGKKVMAGLYEFPYFDKETTAPSFYPGKLHKKQKCKEVKHTFTRYRARLFPTIWEAEEKKEVEGFLWASSEKMKTFPFSSGHRKIYQELMEEHANLTYRKF